MQNFGVGNLAALVSFDGEVFLPILRRTQNDETHLWMQSRIQTLWDIVQGGLYTLLLCQKAVVCAEKR